MICVMKIILNALSPFIGNFLGSINLVGDRFSYPLGLSLADSFIAKRTVLVGDSAHGIHPLAGQGLNLGLKDIAALTEVLALAKRRGESFSSKQVLERYQKWRRFDTSAMAVATDSINKLFSNDNIILRSMRDIGLGKCKCHTTFTQKFYASCSWPFRRFTKAFTRPDYLINFPSFIWQHNGYSISNGIS